MAGLLADTTATARAETKAVLMVVSRAEMKAALMVVSRVEMMEAK